MMREGDQRKKVDGLHPAEMEVYRTVSRWKGTRVYRTGWPDFLVVCKGSVWCIEVKRGKDPVTEAQRQMHEALAAKGIPTFIVRDGWCAELGQRFDLPGRRCKKKLAWWAQL